MPNLNEITLKSKKEIEQVLTITAEYGYPPRAGWVPSSFHPRGEKPR